MARKRTKAAKEPTMEQIDAAREKVSQMTPEQLLEAIKGDKNSLIAVYVTQRWQYTVSHKAAIRAKFTEDLKLEGEQWNQLLDYLTEFCGEVYLTGYFNGVRNEQSVDEMIQAYEKENPAGISEPEDK